MELAIRGGTPVRTRPYPTWPQVGPEDTEAVADVVQSGNWWMYAYGVDELAATVEGTSSVEASELAFARMHHLEHAYATTSGSASLEIACRAIGLGPGDEVITTPYTFVATATCILNAGAVPVFVDIEEDSYNIDPDRIEAAITDRTRAIIPVHFGGTIADMDRITAIARAHELSVIEDAAHAPGASLDDGRWAGSFGDVAIFSLQQSKILTCGEGGLITTNDHDLGELAWSLRHYGRTPTGKWYEHVRLGWHYRMTEMQGALLLTQLAKLPAQNEIRRRNAAVLRRGLEDIPGVEACVQHPRAANDVYYVLCLRYDPSAWDGVSRDRVVEAMGAEGIPVFEGYNWPLYENPVFADPGYRRYRELCPVVERACREQSIWITQDMLLGDEEDTRDITRGFEKVYERRRDLMAE